MSNFYVYSTIHFDKGVQCFCKLELLGSSSHLGVPGPLCPFSGVGSSVERGVGQSQKASHAHSHVMLVLFGLSACQPLWCPQCHFGASPSGEGGMSHPLQLKCNEMQESAKQ